MPPPPPGPRPPADHVLAAVLLPKRIVLPNDEKVADSHRPVILEETELPPRYYLPREDVRTELLRASSSETSCPFKGQAPYWSVLVAETPDGVLGLAAGDPGLVAELPLDEAAVTPLTGSPTTAWIAFADAG